MRLAPWQTSVVCVTGNSLGNTLIVAAGSDTLRGILGHAILYGTDDNDWHSGEGWHDSVHGGAGADALFAGAGDDDVDGGICAAPMDGGAGDDT